VAEDLGYILTYLVATRIYGNSSSRLPRQVHRHRNTSLEQTFQSAHPTTDKGPLARHIEAAAAVAAAVWAAAAAAAATAEGTSARATVVVAEDVVVDQWVVGTRVVVRVSAVVVAAKVGRTDLVC